MEISKIRRASVPSFTNDEGAQGVVASYRTTSPAGMPLAVLMLRLSP